MSGVSTQSPDGRAHCLDPDPSSDPFELCDPGKLFDSSETRLPHFCNTASWGGARIKRVAAY